MSAAPMTPTTIPAIAPADIPPPPPEELLSCVLVSAFAPALVFALAPEALGLAVPDIVSVLP